MKFTMRKQIILLACLFVCQISVAQISITYDNAGNRIQRRLSAPLPVTLVSFTATKEVRTALLNWRTSSEVNADRFEIERSQDGKKWSNIGNVSANGDKTSDSRYSFTDKTPFDGENLYRLKMIDRDGTFTNSRIQSLEFGSQIAFYPNPVKALLKIEGNYDGGVQLLDITGKVVYESGGTPVGEIDMSGFSTGIYIIKIAHRSGSVTAKKVVKE